MQELADSLREYLAFHHQRSAKRHAARRDFWRWQIERPWTDLMPSWAPWAVLVVFWAVLFWVMR